MKINFFLICYVALLGLFSSCKKDAEMTKLQADFTLDSEVIQAGESVVLSDASTGTVSKWNWKFEGADIKESILSNPTVMFEQPGEYTITLVVSNAHGTATASKKVTVGYTAVQADFRADKRIVIQGDEVAFKDSSAGLVESWDWEFRSAGGTVLTSKEQHPKIKFDKVGIYRAKLTISNPEFSDEEVKEKFIEVLDASNLSVDFSASVTGTYEGGSIAFTPSSVGTVNNWLWEFEGGTPATSTVKNPTVTYNQPGRYKVKLSGTNAGGVTKEKVREGYIVVVPGDKLAAYFPFGGSLNDVGPYQFVPTIRGSVTSDGSDRKAVENNVAVFNGASGLVIADHPALNFGDQDYTVAVWLKASKLTKMMVWQESGDKGSKDNQTWLRLLSNTTDQLVTFATEDAKGGAFVNLNEAQKGRWQPGEWFHVVTTRTGLKTSIYINGALAKEGSSGSGVKVVSNAGDFKIGMQRGTNAADGSFTFGNYFNGMMDDLVIYNKALTAAEVAALFKL
ncbi:PKD domain-containing protein [Sphingobacterium sp. N143]|uniref:PKD domain-containing protein n=1 Tax=Sphingobacterium sp. N143 TaxID=2746727 RepID=UPI00257732AF|nr:PKD domain-containing protein [Sphingobacterium sp. N143]MDM1295913.1 PKD domain-containing protein [Sphingobacterium sp. N143]